ncbi:MAG: hypothetical protein K2N01_04045 [Lachnospiraceae bacterium]|nr:hypothetical protein [Lachnospiraceae bacterium]
MAGEIRINMKAAEEALRQLDSVMQEWQQEQAGVREALQGVMDKQQADIAMWLGYMLDDFAESDPADITAEITQLAQDAREFLEAFRQEDTAAAQDIRGDK